MNRAAAAAIGILFGTLVGCAGGGEACPDGNCSSAADTGSLTGTVNGPTGDLVSGATVALLGTDHIALSDVAGKFRIDGVPRGTYSVQATASGLVTVRLDGVVVSAGSSSSILLSLSAAQGQGGTGTVAGFAKLADAATHGGTLVYLQGTGAVAFTAANGGFVLGGLPPGKYTLVARHDGYADAKVANVSVSADAQVDVGTLQLIPGLGPTGIVGGTVTASGSPASGAVVYLTGTSYSAMTAPDGTFAIAGVLPGVYDAVIGLAGYQNKTVPAVSVAASAVQSIGTVDLLPIDATSSPFGRAVGRVTRGGAATGNAGIAVYLAGTSQVAYTDDAGNYAIAQIVPGTYTIGAAAKGYAVVSTAPLAIAAGADTKVAQVDLQPDAGGVGPLGTVDGRALLLGKAAHGGTTVTLSGPGVSLSAVTAADGSYSFAQVPSGVYAIRCEHAGYQPQTIENVVALSGVFHAPDATLYPGARIDARVLSSLTLLPTDATALMNFQEGPDSPTYAYDVGPGTFRTAAPGTMSVCATDATGTWATVNLHGTYRLNTSTLALDPVSPPSNGFITSFTPGKCMYSTGTGLAAVTPDSTVATQVLGLPCAGATVVGMSPLQSSGQWYQVQVNGTCGASFQTWFAFLNVATGAHSNYGTYGSSSWFSADRTSLYSQEVDPATNLQTLERIDLVKGTASIVASAVSRLFFDTFFSVPVGAFSVTDPTSGRGTVLALDLNTGATTPLLTNAQLTSGISGGNYAIATAGSPSTYNVVRFDLKTTHELCAATDNIRAGDPLSCSGVAAPFELLGYDFGSDTVRRFSSAAQSWSQAGHVFWWAEGTGTLAASVANTAPAIDLGSTSTSSNAIASDGSYFVVKYDTSAPTARFLAYPLSGGAATTLLQTNNIVGLTSATATRHGKNVVATYYASGPIDDPAMCGISGFHYCLVAAGATPFPVPYPSVAQSSAEDDSAMFFWFGSPLGIFVTFGASGAVITTVSDVTDVPAWGAAASFAIVRDSSAALFLADLQAGTRVFLAAPGQSPQRLGSTSEYRVGAKVVNLSDGTVVKDFGSVNVLGSSADGSAFTYIDGGGTLGRYTAGQGAVDLATRVAAIPGLQFQAVAPPRMLLLTSFDGVTGNLALLDAAAGTLTPLTSNVSQNVVPSGSGKMFVFANPDLAAGDIQVVDLTTFSVTPMNARARWTGSFFPGRTRVGFAGQSPSSVTPQLWVANLDGSGARKLANTVASQFWFSPDESRAFFTAGGLFWAEDKAGGPSIALDDTSPGMRATDASGNLVLYGRSRGDYPSSLRNGTYRVDLR